MELYQLKTFVTVAEEGHLTRASERLHASQPAVSAHIKALEEEFGVSLFVRTPRGMQLTREGEVLRGQAEKALSTIEEIHQKAGMLKDEPAGTIRLGLHIDPRFLRIDRFLSHMQKHFGKVDIHLLQRWSWQQPEALRKGEIDAGFVYGGSEAGDVTDLTLRRFNIVVAGPQEWEERLRIAGWAEIARMPWILTPPDCTFCQIADNAFKKHGLEPLKVTIADQEPVIQTLVRAGVGLSLMIEEEARAIEADGGIAVWDTVIDTVELSFVYLKKREGDALIRTVIRAVRKIWNLT